MVKKNFKAGFESLLGDSEDHPPKSSKNLAGLKKSLPEIRATFIISEDHHNTIKAISYWERKMLKDILYEALEAYIAEYKKDKGEIILPNKHP
jgi:hypothetical protein